MFCLTDSKVVLAWLSSHPRKWKCYVGNRTSEILTRLPRTCWNYVPSRENPADIASRGALPQNLVSSELWWNGPTWLQSDWSRKLIAEPTYNAESVNLENRDMYVDVYLASARNDTLADLFEKISSLRSIIRILARCMRFHRNCRGVSPKISTSWLTSEELDISWKICIRWTQGDSFHDEIQALKKQQPIPRSSNLLSLTPFLDPEQI